MKLKFHLQKFEKNLSFQILEQDSINLLSHNYIIKGVNISVNCVNSPAIHINNRSYNFGGTKRHKVNKNDRHIGICNIAIYLRGDVKAKDDDVVTVPFEDNETRDMFYDLIIESLINWCKYTPNKHQT